MENWIPIKEASDLSGYHPQYLRELIRGEKIRARKSGMGWAVEKGSLEQYIAEAGESDDKWRGPHRRATSNDLILDSLNPG